LGGLRAVLYTDLMQTFVLLGASICVVVFGLAKLGDWSVMTDTMPSQFMSVWRPMSDPDFPWTGILFGAPILGVWYWCTDQFIVQRVLSAANIDHARRGTIFAGFLKLTPLFLFVLPGVIAAALRENGALAFSDNDAALPTLIRELLPAGVRGLAVAGLLAALMSSLSSVFNSCSTLITWDIYKKLRPAASEKSLVRVGQWSTGALVLLGLAWIPMMKHVSKQLFEYIQSVQAYISPPIAAIFLLGILSPRLNAVGAIWSLGVGFVLGSLRLVLQIAKPAEGSLAHMYTNINFLHFAVMLFGLCALVLIVVSLLTAAPSAEKIEGLVRTRRHDRLPDSMLSGKGRGLAWRRQDLFLSVLLVAGVAAIWFCFR